MANAKVILSADGQSLDLDDSIAGDDTLLRQALVAFYPQMATAKIERTTVDGQMRVTVSKQAGPKGARGRAFTGVAFIDALLGAPEHVNPAVELAADLDGAGPDGVTLSEAMLLGDYIDQTIEAAEEEMRQVRSIFEALRDTAAIPGPGPVEGF